MRKLADGAVDSVNHSEAGSGGKEPANPQPWLLALRGTEFCGGELGAAGEIQGEPAEDGMKDAAIDTDDEGFFSDEAEQGVVAGGAAFHLFKFEFIGPGNDGAPD